MSMLKNKRTAFTLLESMVALIVTGLVLMTIQFSLSLLKTQTPVPLDITLRAVAHQIEVQKYTFISAHKDHVILNNSEGKPMNLEVRRNQLQIAAVGAGQIVMAQNIRQLTVIDHTSYLGLEIIDYKGQKANCLLYLKKGKEHV